MVYRMTMAILISGLMLLTGCEKHAVITARLNETGCVTETSGLKAETEAAQPVLITEESRSVTVFVCGAVRVPGVYTLPDGARAAEAVEEAGGFREDADPEWENLARFLSDGERVRIPTLSETNVLREAGICDAEEEAAEVSAEGQLKTSVVNINTASKEELMTLSGIGESRALDIIAYRELNGPFRSVSDICKVGGIGDAIFAKIRDRITV